jgi:hypothetical protein
LILLALFLDCPLVLSFLLMYLLNATSKPLLHCLEVLKFSAEIGYSGLTDLL